VYLAVNKDNLTTKYPDYPIPNYTLNGSIATIVGLYDYYKISSNPLAKTVLEACITSVLGNIHKFRVKDKMSWYCLSHKVQRELYCNIHVKQLKGLFDITNDSLFINWSDSLRSDYP